MVSKKNRNLGILAIFLGGVGLLGAFLTSGRITLSDGGDLFSLILVALGFYYLLFKNEPV